MVFKRKISESLKGKIHPWNIELNKNPEKISKTANNHKGMKRSEKAKENMRNCNRNPHISK